MNLVGHCLELGILSYNQLKVQVNVCIMETMNLSLHAMFVHSNHLIVFINRDFNNEQCCALLFINAILLSLQLSNQKNLSL